jgi:hypothetical protein
MARTLVRNAKLKRIVESPVERVINRKSRPLPRKKSPVEQLVEDSYDEVMEGYEEKDYAEAPSSFQSRRKATEEKYRKRYIIRATVIDKYSIYRTRVLMTPSMCDVHGCNFDIATKNGFDGYDDVPRSERKRILEALQAHKDLAHNNSENYIIEEKDMPTRWLGTERGLKGI